MSTLLKELRYSVRRLLETPGFSLTAVLVLALGIGANAAVFSLVNGLLLKPIAGADSPGHVVGVYSRDRARPGSWRLFSYPEFIDVRDRAAVFSDVAAFTMALVGIGEGDTTRRTTAIVTTGRYFAALGVGLAAGRTFTADEERPGARAAVAIVSDRYWRSHGQDPALVGTTVRINAHPFTIVGIAPAGFTGPSVVLAPEIWVPTGANDLVANDFARSSGPNSLGERTNRQLFLIGRLRPGETEAGCRPAMRALSTELEAAYPVDSRNQDLSIHRLSRVSMTVGPRDDSTLMVPFGLLMVMAAIVLLVATLNLANMMLARGTARRKEVAVRLALGGTRRHIVRQLLIEGLVLALVGGAAGLVIGSWGVSLLVSTLVPVSPVPLAFDARPDSRVLAVTLAVCGLATILFGLGPARRLARTDVVGHLKERVGGDHPGGRSRRFGMRNLLVASQIALSLGLLTAAGLFTRGAMKASHADPGYRLDRQLLASVDTALSASDEPRTREVCRRLLERMRALPGVQAVSLSSSVAFGDYGESRTVQSDGTPPQAEAANRQAGREAAYFVVGAEYFRTLGVPVLHGREFTRREEEDVTVPPVAVIDEPLARALFPGRNPVGARIRLPDAAAADGPQVMEVVGVVAGLRHTLTDRTPVPHIYVPYGRHYRTWMNIHLRVESADPALEAATFQATRRELRSVDARLPVLGLMTLTQHRDASVLYWVVKAGARVFTVLGALAMFLAVVGLYAVKAYTVGRRTREFGIRMALGSTPRQVLALVLKEGLGVTLAGLGAGFLIAVAIGQFVASLLYEVDGFDPVVFTGAVFALGAAALAACYVPARRATRAAPTLALRSE